MENFDGSDIETSIRRLDELLGCGIFDSKNPMNPLLKSAFIEVLIALRDLMYKSEKYSNRIDFDDDIQKTGRVKDVSDLIKFVRDAFCHPDSDHHLVESGNIKATFNVLFR